MRCKLLALIFSFHLVWAIVAIAQGTTASISGTISDPQHAVLPAANITVRLIDTDLLRRTVTDEQGFFRVPSLPPGNYEVSVEREGFASTTRKLTLTVAEDAVLNLPLAVGRQTAEVVVHGDTTTLDTATSTMSGLVDDKTIRNLPLNGRDLSQLVLLQPSAVWSRGSVDSGPNGRGTHIAVAGSRPYQNLFVIDGTIVNDALNNTPGSAQGLLVGTETVKEFRVLTNTFGAEYGRASGGVFVAVTNSGTNQFHGSAFEFLRNDALDARNYFDQQKPEFRRNQFGGTLGGPVVRDRTFFFVSYEGLREFKGVTTVSIVPDDNARNGILPGHSPIAVDPRSLPILDLFPLANSTALPGGTAEFVGVTDKISRDDFVTARVDHAISSSDSLFVKYLFDDSYQVLPIQFPEFANQTQNRKQVVTIGERKMVGPRVVNELTFGFNRTSPTDGNAANLEQLQLIAGRPLGLIQVGGLTDVGTDYTVPRVFVQNDFQVSDVLSVVRGRHYLRLGGIIERFQDNARAESRTRGQLRFASLADLLNFKAQDFQGSSLDSDFARGYRQVLGGVFLQDAIRVTQRFNVNVGLRYEKVSSPSEVNGKISTLPNVLDPAMTLGGSLFTTPSTAFAPRIGVAWDPRGNAQTVLHAGFGIFYDQPLFDFYRNAGFSALPFANTALLPGSSITALPIDPALLAGGSKQTEAVQYQLHRSYAIQYNLNLEQQLFGGSVLTLAYVGSRGVNVFGGGDVNTAVPVILPDGEEYFPAGSTRRNPNFGQIRQMRQGFDSYYNSLTATAVRRFHSGLQLQISYTFGKSIDDVSGYGTLNWQNGQSGFFDPDRPWLDRARSNFDIRHSFLANATYDLPFRSHGRLDRIIGGWQLNTIVSLLSGVPFTPNINGDPDRDVSDYNTARPDLVPGVSLTPPGGPTPTMWFNPAAFAAPQPGFRGTAGRNILVGPNYRTVDVSAVKTIGITERQKLQLKLEGFNIFNRPNFALPANSRSGEQIFTFIPASGGRPARFVPSPGVGQVFSTAGDARQIQVAAKYLF